ADAYCGDGLTKTEFMRDDLVTLKNHMKAVVAAIGALPPPYALEKGHWSLPASACKGKNGFVPISVGYESEFSTTGAQNEREQQQRELAAAYQKKIVAAEAAGDYETMQKLVGQQQAQSMRQSMPFQQKDPVAVSISVNDTQSMTIDPDAVRRDGAGFLALRTDGGPAHESVVFFFDRVALKNAHQLASFDLGTDMRTPQKLGLLNIEIALNGPTEMVERLVRQLDTEKVLSQLSEARTKGED
ncbi:MAG TPA: hypothetical protein VFH85_07965, partial [Gammaproteobacteria bacterium]|nr:hypothetical protein [Gammaproteobacteria bacterium]